MTDLYAKYGTIPYSVVSGDLDTVGSVVKIADEEFYVIGQEDSTHVKLLSKWNLNVGPHAKGTATGLQDSDVKGWDNLYSIESSYGDVLFSDTNYWYDYTNDELKDEYGDYIVKKGNNEYIFYDSSDNRVSPYVYDNNASIKTYVDNYVTYLNNQGVQVSGRLISREEVTELGCNPTDNVYNICAPIVEGHEDLNGIGTAPEWVYQTSYWTGSAFSYYRVYGVYNVDGMMTVNWLKTGEEEHTTHEESTSMPLGVRPVIILEK